MGLIGARDPRGFDMALRATWQRHSGPHGVYVARCDVYIIYISYLGL